MSSVFKNFLQKLFGNLAPTVFKPVPTGLLYVLYQAIEREIGGICPWDTGEECYKNNTSYWYANCRNFQCPGYKDPLGLVAYTSRSSPDSSVDNRFDYSSFRYNTSTGDDWVDVGTLGAKLRIDFGGYGNAKVGDKWYIDCYADTGIVGPLVPDTKNTGTYGPGESGGTYAGEHNTTYTVEVIDFKGYVQDFEDALLQINLTTCTDEWLDYWGEYFGIPRLFINSAYEDDETYRARIIKEIIMAKGTRSLLLEVAKDYFKSNLVDIIEYHQTGAKSVVVGTDNNYYECILDHVSSGSNRPITGGSWSTYWKQGGLGGNFWVNGFNYISGSTLKWDGPVQAMGDPAKGLWPWQFYINVPAEKSPSAKFIKGDASYCNCDMACHTYTPCICDMSNYGAATSVLEEFFPYDMKLDIPNGYAYIVGHDRTGDWPNFQYTCCIQRINLTTLEIDRISTYSINDAYKSYQQMFFAIAIDTDDYFYVCGNGVSSITGGNCTVRCFVQKRKKSDLSIVWQYNDDRLLIPVGNYGYQQFHDIIIDSDYVYTGGPTGNLTNNPYVMPKLDKLDGTEIWRFSSVAVQAGGSLLQDDTYIYILGHGGTSPRIERVRKSDKDYTGPYSLGITGLCYRGDKSGNILYIPIMISPAYDIVGIYQWSTATLNISGIELISNTTPGNRDVLGRAIYDSMYDNVFGSGGSTESYYYPVITKLNKSFCSGGVATADSSSGSDTPDKAFDRDYTTRWSGTGTSGWIQYDLSVGVTKVCTQIRFYPCYVNVGHPAYDRGGVKDFRFQASNDGVIFDTLYTGLIAFVDQNKWNYFNIPNTTAYRYYRIQVDSTWPSGVVHYPCIIEIDMFDPEFTWTTTFPDNPSSYFCTLIESLNSNLLAIHAKWRDYRFTYGGTITQSAGTGSNVFDGSLITYWGASITSWVKYDLSQYQLPRICRRLKIWPYGAGLKDFRLQGSNDDVDYVTVYSGQHGNNASVETFEILNSTAYRYYKFIVDSVWSGSGCNIAEIWMIEYNSSHKIYLDILDKSNGSIVTEREYGIMGCTCYMTCYSDTPCSCDATCDVYSMSCSCDSTCYGYQSCSCDSSCYQQTCVCNIACYAEHWDTPGLCQACNLTCYVEGCNCNATCYGDQPCTCNATCYNENLLCNCYNTCYGYQDCSCNYSCYEYTPYACACDWACYGYGPCSCDITCYGYETVGKLTKDATVIWKYDASSGSWSIVNFGEIMFYSPPGIGDTILFGDTSQFSGLFLELTSGVGGSYVWEYWNGSNWTALTYTDLTSGLTATGSVHWLEYLKDWKTADNVYGQIPNTGVSLYWMRCRILTNPVSVPIINYGLISYTGQTCRGSYCGSGIGSCKCNTTCYDYVPCTCDSSMYGGTPCSCNSTCYGYHTCDCDLSTYGYSACSCNVACYGYSSCSCNYGRYGYSCPCDFSCDNYTEIAGCMTCYMVCYTQSCVCNAMCYGYTGCSCDLSCYGYSPCTCNATCYNDSPCSCDATCYSYVPCICDATCYGYSPCSCDMSAHNTVSATYNPGMRDKNNCYIYLEGTFNKPLWESGLQDLIDKIKVAGTCCIINPVEEF